MDIPANTLRHVLYGETNLSRDTWNIVLHSVGDGSYDSATLQEIAEGWAEAFNSDIWSNSDSTDFFNDATNLVGCSSYLLSTTNHVIEMGTYNFASPVPGGHAGALPSECALCCTFLTAKDGRSYTGRMYLPGLAPTVLTADGIISTATTETLASRVASFIADASTVAPGGSTPTVAGVLSVTKGQLNTILGGKVGNVMDVQRRRRNGGVEDYSVW
jgi:hypothetical protein